MFSGSRSGSDALTKRSRGVLLLDGWRPCTRVKMFVSLFERCALVCSEPYEQSPPMSAAIVSASVQRQIVGPEKRSYLQD